MAIEAQLPILSAFCTEEVSPLIRTKKVETKEANKPTPAISMGSNTGEKPP